MRRDCLLRPLPAKNRLTKEAPTSGRRFFCTKPHIFVRRPHAKNRDVVFGTFMPQSGQKDCYFLKTVTPNANCACTSAADSPGMKSSTTERMNRAYDLQGIPAGAAHVRRAGLPAGGRPFHRGDRQQGGLLQHFPLHQMLQGLYGNDARRTEEAGGQGRDRLHSTAQRSMQLSQSPFSCTRRP